MTKVIKIPKEDYVERPRFNAYWRDRWGTTVTNPRN